MIKSLFFIYDYYKLFLLPGNMILGPLCGPRATMRCHIVKRTPRNLPKSNKLVYHTYVFTLMKTWNFKAYKVRVIISWDTFVNLCLLSNQQAFNIHGNYLVLLHIEFLYFRYCCTSEMKIFFLIYVYRVYLCFRANRFGP